MRPQHRCGTAFGSGSCQSCGAGGDLSDPADRSAAGYLHQCFRPGVLTVGISADGITNLCRFGKKTGILKKKDNIILTPHPGECDRLLDALDLEPVSVMGRVEAAEAVSDRTGAVVLLKGADTVVTSGSGSTYINTTGNPGMATGGSGDVLTGVITAFAASGIAPLDAARAGAFVHGMAGDLAAGIMGQWGMTATDIRDQLPATLRGIVGK